MFPTPPSLEQHNQIASPCGGHLSDTPGSDPADYISPLSNTRYKQEICPSMGSPHDESIDVSVRPCAVDSSSFDEILVLIEWTCCRIGASSLCRLRAPKWSAPRSTRH